jgi:hypothetical protein
MNLECDYMKNYQEMCSVNISNWMRDTCADSTSTAVTRSLPKLEIRLPEKLSLCVTLLCFERGRLSLPCGSVVQVQRCGHLKNFGLRSGGLSFRYLVFYRAQSTMSTFVETVLNIHFPIFTSF